MLITQFRSFFVRYPQESGFCIFLNFCVFQNFAFFSNYAFLPNLSFSQLLPFSPKIFRFWIFHILEYVWMYRYPCIYIHYMDRSVGSTHRGPYLFGLDISLWYLDKNSQNNQVTPHLLHLIRHFYNVGPQDWFFSIVFKGSSSYRFFGNTLDSPSGTI